MRIRAWWLQAIVTAAAYVVAGELALIAAGAGHVAAVWPAAGIALVAASRWGTAGALGVLAGSLAVNASSGEPVVAGLLACGAGLRAILGAELVRRFVRDDTLTHGRDAVTYLALGGPAAGLIGAVWTAGVLWRAGIVAGADVPFTGFTYLVGDTIGVVVTAPILLALFGEPRSSWRPRLWSVAVPLAATAAAIVLAFGAARWAQRERAESELAVRAAVVANALEQRLERYADTVAATAGFIAVNPALTRDEFATFASGAFGRDHDFVGLGWAPRITRDTRDAFEAAVRARDPDYAIRVMAPAGPQLAPDRPLLFPILFIEPAALSRGIDVSFGDTRAQAIARATASGAPAATRPLRLLDGRRGFLIFSAVRGHDPEGPAGVVIGGFAGTSLLDSVTSRIDTNGLWITLTDVTSDTADPVVGSWIEATGWSRQLAVGGRVWRVGVAHVGAAAVGWEAWLVLAAGLVFASVLGGIVLAITGGRARIAEAEARYRDLYENAPDMYFTIRAHDAAILECNATAAQELGFRQRELVGMSLADLVEPASREAIARGLAMLAETGVANVPHVALRCKDDHRLDASVTATAIYDGDRVIAARTLFRNVTELVEAERDHLFQVELGDALHASESIHAVMARAAARISEHLGIEVCHYGEIDAAAGTVALHQYSRGKRESVETVPAASFEGAGTAELLSGARYVVEDVALDERTAQTVDAYKPRELRSFIAIPLMRGGVTVAYFAVVSATPRAWTPRDVSLVQSVAERTWLWSEHLRSVHDLRDLSRYLEERVEERTRDLVAAVGEKEVLLKEIHHRVKNNLQVISSMLNLQARRVQDRELASAFEESQQRIHTIALVHERLYQSRDLSNIGIDDYLKSLVENVMYAQNARERGITAHTDVAGISLPIQLAIPCGLIVNELITNAVKHAFPTGTGGTINVSMKSVGGRIELAIADDGVGLPPGLDPAKADTLGLDLVYAFAEQLDAELDIRSGKGASFTLRFAPS